jgi:DNA-binding MarR family transcriptional regulator
MAVDAPTLTLARLNRVLENHGSKDLSLPQYRVLGVLATGGERATQLASRLGVTKPTLTALVDSLVERGLVARDTPAGDRRAVRLSITAAGRSMLTSSGKQFRAAFEDVLSRCPDRDAVLAALAQLSAALDARWHERVDQALSPTPAAASRAGAAR